MSTHIRKVEISQKNNLMIPLKLVEKQEQANSKSKDRKEIIKIRIEINKLEIKKYNESTKQKGDSVKK
jgi:hypothetical protein